MSTTVTDEQVETPERKPSTGRRAWHGVESVFAGFRSFIMRGNIIDLAVGVVIGVAFNALVTDFTKDFIQPLIKVFSGGKELAGTFTISDQAFNWSDFVNAVVNFLLVAGVLYFIVVMPMNKIAERRARLTGAAAPAVPPDIALLTQIRDALVAANERAGIAAPPPVTDDVTDVPARDTETGTGPAKAAPSKARSARKPPSVRGAGDSARERVPGKATAGRQVPAQGAPRVASGGRRAPAQAAAAATAVEVTEAETAGNGAEHEESA